MSLAENLLNSLSTENISEDYSTNEEEHIVVDNTRKITVPAKLRTIAVTGDKDVETVTIDCVRYWDSHDLSSFGVYINYMLPNGETGTYIPEGVVRYDDYFSFNWVIGRNVTKYNGTLSFLILTRQTDDEGNLLYQWSSLLNGDCTISKGLDTIKVPEEQFTQDVVSQILQNLKLKLSYDNISNSTGYNNNLVMSQKVTTEELNKRANAFVGKVSGEIVAMDDVSPLEHKVPVKLSSKSLFDIPDLPFENVEYKFIDCNITEPITISAVVDNVVVLENGEPISIWRFAIYYQNGKLDYYTDAQMNSAKTFNATKGNPITKIVCRDTYITSGAYRNIQIETGTEATPYRPYIPEDTQVTLRSCGKNWLPYDTYGQYIPVAIPKGTTVAVSAGNPTAEAVHALFYDVDKNRIVFEHGSIDFPTGNRFYRTFTLPQDAAYMMFAWGAVPNITVINGQLEINTIATAYEPYKEGETITTTIAEGAELTSISPNMTIFTDTTGAVIDCTYNKDSNKVIEKLTQAIISLGGIV